MIHVGLVFYAIYCVYYATSHLFWTIRHNAESHTYCLTLFSFSLSTSISTIISICPVIAIGS